MLSKSNFDDNLRGIFEKFLFTKMDYKTKAVLKYELEDCLISVAKTSDHGVTIKLFCDDYNRKVSVQFKKGGRIIRQSTVFYDHLMSCRHHLSYYGINSI